MAAGSRVRRSAPSSGTWALAADSRYPALKRDNLGLRPLLSTLRTSGGDSQTVPTHSRPSASRHSELPSWKTVRYPPRCLKGVVHFRRTEEVTPSAAGRRLAMREVSAHGNRRSVAPFPDLSAPGGNSQQYLWRMGSLPLCAPGPRFEKRARHPASRNNARQKLRRMNRWLP